MVAVFLPSVTARTPAECAIVVENVAPKAGPRSGFVIGAIALVVLLSLIFFYWMGAWRDSAGALDADGQHDPRIEQQPAPGAQTGPTPESQPGTP